MHRFLEIAVVLSLSFGCAGWAADASDFSIMGIGLHLTPDQVLKLLGTQSEQIASDAVPCPGTPERVCVTKISARVPDGMLEVSFRDFGEAGPLSSQIRLAIAARGMRDSQLVREAAEDRYGVPSSDQPSWCVISDQKPGNKDKGCDTSRPSLRFDVSNQNETAVVLSDGR